MTGPFVSEIAVDPTGSGPLDGWDVAVQGHDRGRRAAVERGSRTSLVTSAETDAPVVGRLRSAGARIVGMTRMHQLACGVTGINDNQGTPTNPGWPDRIPGGSSSGSAAAVAAGAVRAAIGTDTGGSVRIPAACCGVVGVKPGRGAIPLDGVIPCASSLDHVGVFARTVDDAMTVLAAVGVDVGVAPTDPVVGVDGRTMAAASPEVRAAIEPILAGLDTIEIELPDPERVAATSTTVLLGEFARVHTELADEHRAALGDDIVGRLQRGAAISDAELDAARADLVALETEVRSVLAEVTVIAMPTLPGPAPTIDEARHDPLATAMLLVTNTRLANCTGLPALSVPVAADVPVGLQLIGAELGALVTGLG